MDITDLFNIRQPPFVGGKQQEPPNKITAKPIESTPDKKFLENMQANIRKAQNLRSEITLLLQESNPSLPVILNKALYCIALMTGETITYETQMKALNKII